MGIVAAGIVVNRESPTSQVVGEFAHVLSHDIQVVLRAGHRVRDDVVDVGQESRIAARGNVYLTLPFCPLTWRRTSVAYSQVESDDVRCGDEHQDQSDAVQNICGAFKVGANAQRQQTNYREEYGPTDEEFLLGKESEQVGVDEELINVTVGEE